MSTKFVIIESPISETEKAVKVRGTASHCYPCWLPKSQISSTRSFMGGKVLIISIPFWLFKQNEGALWKCDVAEDVARIMAEAGLEDEGESK